MFSTNVQGFDFAAISSAFMALGPIAVFLFWCGILFVISRVSGWSRLAERYAASGPAPSKVHRFRSARFGWPGYNNCLTIGGDMRGLYLAMFPVLRQGHTPLYIPWHDVEAYAGDMWVVSYVEFRFPRLPKLRIRVTRALGESIIREAGGVIPIREDVAAETSAPIPTIKSGFTPWS